MISHEIAETVNFRQNSRKNAFFGPGAGLLVMRILVTFPLLFLVISCRDNEFRAKNFFRESLLSMFYFFT